VVARFGEIEVERLLGDAGIVRHRGKIVSTINNAQRALELIDEFGSIGTFLDQFVPAPGPGPVGIGDIPAKTAESAAISKELKRRGWSFVGPTTVYAFMQSMGLVNDHLAGCSLRAA
jgi:DNA-3-methyladenine glycosylase I